MGQPPDSRPLERLQPTDILSQERIDYCGRVIDALLKRHKFYNSLSPEAQLFAREGMKNIALSIMVDHDGRWRSANVRKIKDQLHHGKKKDGPLDKLKHDLHTQYSIPKKSQLNQFGDDLLERFVDMCTYGVETIEDLEEARHKRYNPPRHTPQTGTEFHTGETAPPETRTTSLVAKIKRRRQIFQRKRP
ncbi:hypothetical protein HYW54_03905 [Candidatus Gottesmanbacteria bacterium]|nr:hypothetical protein [Candidatus Gottesmanbacteria bacterium]